VAYGGFAGAWLAVRVLLQSPHGRGSYCGSEGQGEAAVKKKTPKELRTSQWARKEKKVFKSIKDAIQALYDIRRVALAQHLEDFLGVVREAIKG
jgi:hypothetical protein